MSLANSSSGRRLPPRFRGVRRHRRATRLSRFVPGVLALEERCLLASSSSVLGTETLVNSTVAGSQSFSIESDRSIAVAGRGPGKGQRQTVFARVFDASGSPVTGEILVPGTRSGAQRDPAVISLPDGGFQVAWDGNGTGDPNGIFSRQFNGAGKPLGP